MGIVRCAGCRGLRLLGILLLSLFASACNPVAAGQLAVEQELVPRNLYFTHIGPRQGLSQSAVNAIVQDRFGYIWLGTQEGLNRWNGYEMKVFQASVGDPGALSHDWIWSLHADPDGVIWIGTDGGGLNRYDPVTGRFSSYRHDDKDPHSLSNDRVRVVLRSRQGHFWLGTDGGGLDRFDPETGIFEHFRHDPDDPGSLPGDKILSLFEDGQGILWVGTDNGLARFDKADAGFTTFRRTPGDPRSLSDDKVRRIYEDRQGRLWIGTYNGGLNLMDRVHGTFLRFMHDPQDPHSLGHNWVRDILEDVQGTLWIATDGGLDEYRPGAGGFVHYRHDPLEPASLSDDRLISLFQDSGKVLWVGSYKGLNKWNYVSDVFNEVRFEPVVAEAGNSGVVTSLAEGGGGELFVGIYGEGVHVVSPESSEVRVIRHHPDDPASLSDDRVMSLMAEDNRLWIGTRRGGLNLLDLANGHMRHYRHRKDDAHSLGSNAVTAIYRDRQGRLWVGTYGGGLNLFDPEADGFQVFRHDPENPQSLSNDRVIAIYQDRAGMLWIGTEDGGLNRYDPETGGFLHFMSDKVNGGGISSNKILHINEGQDGSLWISTLDGGLNRWLLRDRRANRPEFQSYQRAQGLRSNAVYAALEDAQGHIWFSSNRGVTRLNPFTGDIRHYDRFNGLREDEFNSGAYLKGRNGRLYFGGTGYLLAFDPSQIMANAHPPEVVLYMLAGGRQVASSSSRHAAQGERRVDVGYRDNRLVFRFAGLDYASPHMNRYKYRLEGFDEQWIEPQHTRIATYTNLPPGNYRFRVLASNNDGVWNGTGASIAFHVQAPPWRSPLAYMFYLMILAGMVIAYLRMQQKKHQEAEERRASLEQEVQARTRELNQRNEELRQLNDTLRKMSVTDSLTGLLNRRYLQQTMDQRIAAIKRRAEDLRLEAGSAETLDITPSLFFMMIDLDGFKAINDNFGHAAGDRALLQVRDILRASCRKSDNIIRWGGDEFLIVGENTGVQATERLAERVRRNLANARYEVGPGQVGVLTGSIGFSMYPFSRAGEMDQLSWEQVVVLADHAAYTAKHNGRNAWVGVTGTRNSSWAEIAADDINLVALAKKGVITLRTSLKSLHETVKRGNESATR